MNQDALEFEPGHVVQDTYRIDELLGRGGMGATYKGVNLATQHDVAIKVMHPNFAHDDRGVQLFKRESTLLRDVRHDAVIRYETTLQDRAGRLYLIMELIDGKPLSHYIQSKARLAPEDVLKLGRRLAGGLAAIHALGIVHRDVAPDNILLPHGQIEQAKLIDFGLASDTVNTDQSIIGHSFAGKMSYAAPEQFGLFGNRITPRTDAYALGLVLLKVAGLPIPGQGEGMAAVDKRKTDITVDGAGSEGFKRAVEALLRADPDDRPADLVDLFEKAINDPRALKAGATGQTGQGSAPVASGGGTSRTLLTGAAAALVVVGIGAALVLGGGGNDPEPADEITGPGTASNASAAPVTATPAPTPSPAPAPVTAAAPTAGIASVPAPDPAGPTAAAVEGEGAEELLAVESLIAEGGGPPRLSGVIPALNRLVEDPDAAIEVRQRAALVIARMADPESFRRNHSAVTGPSPNLALLFYIRAQELGAPGLDSTIARLGGR